MIRKLFVLFFLIHLHHYGNAQKGNNYLSIGASIGIPLNFMDNYKPGGGAGLRAYFGVAPKGSILANVNFISFPPKYPAKRITLASLKLGYATRLTNPKLFLYGDGGLVIKSPKGSKSDADPGIGFGIGYSIPTKRDGFLDIVPSFNIVFQDVINRTWLDLHFAYRFRTGRR